MNSCISSRVCCLQVSFHATPACRGTHCSGSQAARPRNPGSPRVALVTSRREDPVQVVHDGPLVDDSWTHVGVYLGLTDISCRCTRSIRKRASSSGDLVVPRTRRRIGDRAFSVAAPRAWNTLPTQLKLLRSTTSFRRQLKTFLFQSGYAHGDAD